MESNVALSTWLIVFGMFVVLFAVPMAILEYERRREIRRLERAVAGVSSSANAKVRAAD